MFEQGQHLLQSADRDTRLYLSRFAGPIIQSSGSSHVVRLRQSGRPMIKDVWNRTEDCVDGASPSSESRHVLISWSVPRIEIDPEVMGSFRLLNG